MDKNKTKKSQKYNPPKPAVNATSEKKEWKPEKAIVGLRPEFQHLGHGFDSRN